MAVLTTTTDTERDARIRARHRAARRRPRGRPAVIPGIVLILMCAYSSWPFYWCRDRPQEQPGAHALPAIALPTRSDWFELQDATEAFPFWKFAWNTTAITALTIVGSVISNPLIAYGFSRIDWPGRDKVFLIVLATVFMPFPVLIIALFDIFAKLHLLNTYWPLVLPMFFGQAFWIFLMRQFLMQIPKDLSDAAASTRQRVPDLPQIIRRRAAGDRRDRDLRVHPRLERLPRPLIFLRFEQVHASIGLTFFQQQDAYDVSSTC